MSTLHENGSDSAEPMVIKVWFEDGYFRHNVPCNDTHTLFMLGKAVIETMSDEEKSALLSASFVDKGKGVRITPGTDRNMLEYRGFVEHRNGLWFITEAGMSVASCLFTETVMEAAKEAAAEEAQEAKNAQEGKEE